jgi:hypothetical protein
MNRPLAAVGAVAGAALALAGLQVVGAGSASANPAGTGLVISEVFTGAANGTSPYDADYVELYNPTSAAIDLSGKSLQLRHADDTVIGTVSLTGSVPAQHHFLVQVDAASTSSATHQDLPTPDLVADPALTMSTVNQAAEVILGDASGSAPDYGTGNLAGKAHVIDMVGFAGAGSYETASADLPTGVSQIYNSAHRADGGVDTGADTDDNAADFTWAGPTPENTTSSSAARVEPTLSADTTMYLAYVAPGHTTWPTSLGEAVIVLHASGASGTPTGTVQISGPAGYATGEATLTSGTAYGQYDTTGLAPGTYQLTLSYNGNATYAPTSTTFSLTVEAGSTASKVTAPDASVTANEDLSEQVTVASAASGGATPTGVVSIWSGDTLLSKSFGTTLASGSATVAVPYAKLAPGDNTLTVKYSGDDTYAQSETTMTVTTPAVASTTTVTAPGVTAGTAGHASVKVAAGDLKPSGEVTLTGAGASQTKAIDENGNVSFDLPATLAAGSYTLTASYAGDTADRILASSGTVTFTVAAAQGDHVVTPPTHAQQKLAKDQTKLHKAKKKLKKAKKAHNAKKVKKLKKKVKKLKKAVKKDKKLVKAGK